MTDDCNADTRASTNLVYRPDSHISGLRLVQEDSARIAVLAFPFADIPRLAGRRSVLDRSRTFQAAAAYGLSDGAQIYFGETGNILDRLNGHFAKREKHFATEVFVVSTFDTSIDKPAAIHMQHAFSAAAKDAGLMHVVEGTSPQLPSLTAARAAAVNKMIEGAYPLLYDAGLRAFHSANSSQLDRLALRPADTDLSDDEIESTALEIGATTAKDAIEYHLVYGNVWAYGYGYPDRFVLGVGSEIRCQINPSANPIYQLRRRQLLERHALAPIPNVVDRLRLVTPVAVGSAAIAAKVACGAHVNAGVWKIRHRRGVE